MKKTLATLEKDETHHTLSGDAAFLRPMEKKAWELAHEIYPTLDTRLEDGALQLVESDSSDRGKALTDLALEKIRKGKAAA